MGSVLSACWSRFDSSFEKAVMCCEGAPHMADLAPRLAALQARLRQEEGEGDEKDGGAKEAEPDTEREPEAQQADRGTERRGEEEDMIEQQRRRIAELQAVIAELQGGTSTPKAAGSAAAAAAPTSGEEAPKSPRPQGDWEELADFDELGEGSDTLRINVEQSRLELAQQIMCTFAQDFQEASSDPELYELMRVSKNAGIVSACRKCLGTWNGGVVGLLFMYLFQETPEMQRALDGFDEKWGLPAGSIEEIVGGTGRWAEGWASTYPPEHDERLKTFKVFFQMSADAIKDDIRRDMPHSTLLGEKGEPRPADVGRKERRSLGGA